MKLLHWSITPSNSWHKNSILLSRAFRVLSYSTNPKTLASSSSSSSSSSAPNDTLWKRLLPVVDQKVSVIPILDQWVAEGRTVDQRDLQKTIKQFRKFRRFNHALQISEWLINMKYLDISPGDIAVQLDLISKVRGLEQAENYFSNIPDTSRAFQVYGALLNCYADAKSLERAEAIMQKMRELGYAKTLSYNVLLNLYSHLGKLEKIDTLIQEMEEKGIACDKFTHNILLTAYGSSSDIKGLDKLLMKMEADPLFTMDWNAYAAAANAYLTAGAIEKALVALNKCESLIRFKKSRSAYDILLSMYAKMGKKEKVYHLWNMYKKLGKVYNMSYLCMISSLEKLDDLDGALNIFGEWLEDWKAENRHFDIRVPNLLITAYCKKGLLKKAESIVNRLVETGKEPDSGTWNRLALGYYRDNQMEKAVEMLKKAILSSQSGWKPMLSVLTSCLEYLKENGDPEGAQEITRLLEEKGQLSTGLHERILEYIEKGKLRPNAPDEPGEDAQIFDEVPEGMDLNTRL